MTPTEKKFQKKALREYFDNHMYSDIIFNEIIKFAEKYELDYDFIEAIKFDHQEHLPF